MINSDSLHTWALAGLAAASDNVQLEILREDQEHSLDLLRAGAAAAAITETAKPVPGCSSSKLGIMRYFPVCAPDFTRRWFGAGVSAATLAAAPVVVFDRKDDLQDRWLRRFSRAPLQPPRHYVPAAQEFGDAIRWGMGWGMMPEIEIGEDLGDRQARDALAPRARGRRPLLAAVAARLGGADRRRGRRPGGGAASSAEADPAGWQDLD